ncbi:MAG TPA: MFS transporter [Anaerolineae bacterium]
MQIYLDRLRSFSREARLFLVALIIFSFATSIPAVFFNLYLQALGFDRTFIGLTTTASQLGGVIFSIPAAGLLDLLGRRHAMLIGAAASIICAAATLLVTNGTLLIIVQVVGGCGVVLYALAVVPLLAEVSTPYERTALFSTTESLTTLTLFLGSLIAGGLPSLIAPLLHAGPESALTYRVVMLGSQALRITGLLPLALIHDHVIAQPAGSPRRSTLSYFDPRVLLRLQTPIWIMALPILTCYLAGSLIFPFLNIYLKVRFNASDIAIGAVLGLINLCIGIATLLGPLAAQRFGRVRVAIFGAFVSAVCLLLVALSDAFIVVALLVIVRAGLFNMTLPLYRAYVIDHTPPHEYTVVNLIYATAANVGPTVAPPVSGYVQDRTGFGPLFVAAVALYGLAGVLFHAAGKQGNRIKVQEMLVN